MGAWEVRVRAHSDFTTLVAVVPRWISLAFTCELNGAGGGQITIDRDDPIFSDSAPLGVTSHLINNECLWQVYEDDVLRGAFLGTKIEEVLLDSQTDRRGIQISGKGPAAVLEWAKVMPPGYPTVTNTFYYTFKNMSVMQMWRTLMFAAQTRGTIPYVTNNFTNTTDSNGVAWPDNGTSALQQENGPTLLSVLEGHADTVSADYYMTPGFQLQVAQTFGTDRSNTVIFHEGSYSTLAKTRVRDRSAIANVISAQDGKGGTTAVNDATSITDYQRRELHVGSSNAISTATRNRLADAALRISRRELDSWTITVEPDTLGRKAFVDYGVGDTIGVEQAPSIFGNASFKNAWKIQVLGIAIDSVGVVTAEVTLQDKQLIYRAGIQKLIEKISSGSVGSAVNGGIPTATTLPLPPDKKIVAPGPPTSLVVSSALYFDGSKAQASLNATWSAPTTNADGSDVEAGDIAGYQVQYALTGSPAEVDYLAAPTVPATANGTTIRALPLGATYRFRVRTIDGVGNNSAWVTTSSATTANDTTPPPVPTQPTLTSRLGTITVTWDGAFVAAAPRPVDFFNTQVHVSTTNGFSPSAATLVATFSDGGLTVLSNLVYSTTYYVKLRAQDFAGNLSAASAQASISVQPLVNTDLIGQVISGANIVDNTITASDKIIGNTITGGLIQALAINAGHIQANAITAGKIQAGAIDATKISLGAVGSPQMALGPSNLAADGGFEDSQWRALRVLSLPSAASFVASAGENAGYVLRFNQATATGTERFVYVTTAPVPCTQGQRYYFSARYKASAVNGTVGLGARWTDAAGGTTFTPMFYSYTTPIDATAWHTVEGVAIVPTGAVSVEPRVGVGTAGTTGNIDFDWVDFRPVLASTNDSGRSTEISPMGFKAYATSSPTGARAELNSNGLQLYDSTNAQTVNLNASDGSALITGIMRTGISGQRVIINPEAPFSTIRFYPSSGTDYAFINAPEIAGPTTTLMIGSGAVAYNGASSRHRLYMSEGIDLTTRRIDNSNQNGYGLRMSETDVYLDRVASTGLRIGGELFMDNTELRLRFMNADVWDGGQFRALESGAFMETNVNGAAAAGSLQLDNLGRLQFPVGRFLNGTDQGADSGWMFGRVTAASGTSWTLNYGTTRATNMAPLVTPRFNTAIGWSLSASSTAGFTLSSTNTGAGEYHYLAFGS